MPRVTDCGDRLGGQPGDLIPRVLLVDTDPHSIRMDALSNAGFFVHRADDVRAVKAAEQAIGISRGEAGVWYGNLELSHELAARMQSSGSLYLSSAVFHLAGQTRSRVELHARRLRGVGSEDERWLVVLRDLGPEELAVRQELETERARRLVGFRLGRRHLLP